MTNSTFLAINTKPSKRDLEMLDFLTARQRSKLKSSDQLFADIFDFAAPAADEMMMAGSVGIVANCPIFKDFPNQTASLQPIQRIVNRGARSHRKLLVDGFQNFIGSGMIDGGLQIFDDGAALRRHFRAMRFDHCFHDLCL